MAYVTLGDNKKQKKQTVPEQLPVVFKQLPVHVQKLHRLLDYLRFEINNFDIILRKSKDKNLITNKAKNITNAIVDSATIIKDYEDINEKIQKRAGKLFNIGLRLIRKYENMYTLGECPVSSSRKSYYTLNPNILQLSAIKKGIKEVARRKLIRAQAIKPSARLKPSLGLRPLLRLRRRDKELRRKLGQRARIAARIAPRPAAQKLVAPSMTPKPFIPVPATVPFTPAPMPIPSAIPSPMPSFPAATPSEQLPDVFTEEPDYSRPFTQEEFPPEDYPSEEIPSEPGPEEFVTEEPSMTEESYSEEPSDIPFTEESKEEKEPWMTDLQNAQNSFAGTNKRKR